MTKAKDKAKKNLTARKNPDWDSLDRGYRYLTQDMKLPHDQAIALMGNVVEESQGNYKAVQKNGGGRGLIQWDGEPAPATRYGQWAKIWASVAKPANVYNKKTDTVENYWAPWGGLKGDAVRQEFTKAPLKKKVQIYSESYLRPGKPRLSDRILSAMQLDSIYNPKIKDILVKKNGGIFKMQEGNKMQKSNLTPGQQLITYMPEIYTLGKFLDPTGISNYGDLREAIQQYDQNTNFNTTKNVIVEGLSSIPLFKYIPKTIKVMSQLASTNGSVKDYQYALDLKNKYDSELVIDYFDNTVKSRKKFKEKLSHARYSDVNHFPSPELAPEGSKDGDIIQNYNFPYIDNYLIKKYKNYLNDKQKNK